MIKRIWGSVPPKTQKLATGETRVYFNVQKVTREEETRDQETGKLMGKQMVDEYHCDSIDVSGELTYEHLTESLIRDRYSVSDELAILRQKDSKPQEFDEYNRYAEECKVVAGEITGTNI